MSKHKANFKSTKVFNSKHLDSLVKTNVESKSTSYYLITNSWDDVCNHFNDRLPSDGTTDLNVVDIFNILAPVLLPLLEKGFQILAKSLDLIVIGAEGAVSVYEALTDETGELNSFTHDYIKTNEDLTKGLENTSFSTGMLTAKEKALEIQMARSIAMDAFYLQQHKDRIKASQDLQVEVQSEDDMINDLIRTNQANTDAIRNQAEEIQNSLLPNLSALVSARNRIIAIQEKEENATKALTRAKTDLIEAGHLQEYNDKNNPMFETHMTRIKRYIKDFPSFKRIEEMKKQGYFDDEIEEEDIAQQDDIMRSIIAKRELDS